MALRIIPKQEVYTEAKSNLAGTCAVRMYYDGNITFSKHASELMEFSRFTKFYICDDEKGNLYLVPNNVSGYAITRRKDKYCFLCHSKPIINYVSNRINATLEKKRPIEFLVKPTKLKIDGSDCFLIELFNQK